MSIRAILLAYVTITLFALSALADIPQTITYQGYLKDSAGVPVSTATSIRFSLYSSNPARNNPVWTETKSITPSNGIYSTQLGSVVPITAPFDVPYHLGVKVGADPEMPLQQLASAPYALRAKVATTAQCTPGDILSCYTGPSRTMNVGPCKAGTKTCGNDGIFGECTQVLPTAEICLNGIDDDCDGHSDEGCQLPNGSACSDSSACVSGYCSNGYCCSSQTGLCCATADNCTSLNQPAVCTPYSNCLPKKTVGICSGSNVCQTALMDDPTACSGQTCADGFCTGTLSLTWTPPSTCNGSGVCTMSGNVMSCDDGNVCTNDFCSPVTGCSHTSNNTPTQSCYTDTQGNPLGGTPGVGICTNGVKTCSNGSFGPCIGAVGATTEICGTSPAQDENCNGLVNEQDAAGCTLFRLDTDQDGYGIASTRCYCTAGYAYVGAVSDKFIAGNSGAYDCNDTTALANPAMTEKCGLPYDEDCDGSFNEDNASDCLLRYLDNDRDGYGTTSSKCTCTPASPYDSTYSTDCNDSNANIYPGKTEICNGIDDNCSGTVDTAEIPIGTLCPTPTNAAGATCIAAPNVTCRAVCATYWWDVDSSFSNGCEVQEDQYDRSGTAGDTCPGYNYGTLYEYGASPYYADFTGNILPTGDVDYYYVYASDSSGDGAVRLDVRFIINTNSSFRYTVYNSTSCSSVLASNQTAPSLFTTPGYYVVRVHRNGGGASPAGETYQLRLSNNLY